MFCFFLAKQIPAMHLRSTCVTFSFAGHCVCVGGPPEATGPSRALGPGGCSPSARAALPWEHWRSQEVWKWRVHIKVGLNLQPFHNYLVMLLSTCKKGKRKFLNPTTIEVWLMFRELLKKLFKQKSRTPLLNHGHTEAFIKKCCCAW